MRSMNRISEIRQKEKEYHDDCYSNIKLFQPGTWLHRPVKTIIELFEHINHNPQVNILDLGCGVGRNSIPLAQKILNREGKIVCVDLLQSAISNLNQYSGQYGVDNKVESVLSDIGSYQITTDFYDLIFSVSALEHLDSEDTFTRVIKNMISGTRAGGINAVIISTNVKETRIETAQRLEPMYELLFDTNNLITKLQRLYEGWDLVKHTIKPYGVEITRDGHRILLEGDVVTWVVRK